MFDPALFAPALAQFALTVVLGTLAGYLRWRAVASGQVRAREIALGQRNWPTRVQQVSNTVNNQWETPTLFYAAIAFAMIAGQGGPVLVALAWVWVLARVAHAAIYITSNHVPARFTAYLLGLLALIGFWVVLSVQALTAA